MIKLSVLMMLTGLITACSNILVSQQSIEYFYVLNPVEHFQQHYSQQPVTLNITRPTASDWLDSRRVILRRDKNAVDFYANTRWVDSLPNLIGVVFTESLENASMMSDVSYASITGQADYQLKIDLTDFQAVYTDETMAPTIFVGMRLVLTHSASGALVTAFRLEHQQLALDNTLTEIIAAFDVGLQSVITAAISDIDRAIRHYQQQLMVAESQQSVRHSSSVPSAVLPIVSDKFDIVGTVTDT